jgi:hypothetical protein
VIDGDNGDNGNGGDGDDGGYDDAAADRRSSGWHGGSVVRSCST